MKVQRLIDILSSYDPNSEVGIAHTGMCIEAYPISDVFVSRDNSIILNATSDTPVSPLSSLYQKGDEVWNRKPRT